VFKANVEKRIEQLTQSEPKKEAKAGQKKSTDNVKKREN